MHITELSTQSILLARKASVPAGGPFIVLFPASGAAAGMGWFIALVRIPSVYRTGRRWPTGKTPEQTELLFTTGQRSLAGPDHQ